MGKTLVGMRRAWNPSYFYGFVWIGGPWYEFLDFYLGFGCMKSQTTNTSVCGVVLDKFHVGFEEWL